MIQEAYLRYKKLELIAKEAKIVVMKMCENDGIDLQIGMKWKFSDTVPYMLTKEQKNSFFYKNNTNFNFQHNFKDHVTFMGAMKNHGLAVIDFKRSIMPHDSVDAPIPMEGPVQVLDQLWLMEFFLTFDWFEFCWKCIFPFLEKKDELNLLLLFLGHCCHWSNDVKPRGILCQHSVNIRNGKCDH